MKIKKYYINEQNILAKIIIAIKITLYIFFYWKKILMEKKKILLKIEKVILDLLSEIVLKILAININ